VLRTATGELLRDGARVKLQEQPLQILEELLLRPGELVTREQLIRRLWPKGVVEFDASLNTAVFKLRAALRDDSERPRYIETLPRKGYRFIGRISPAEESTARVWLAAKRIGPGPWIAAASLAVIAAGFFVALRWNVEGVVDPALSSAPAEAAESVRITTSPEAFALYLEARTKQPDIAPGEPAEPREHVLRLLERAIELDPTFPQAYLVRARVHLDYFLSNLDISEQRVAMMRRDLEMARRLADDELLGLDVTAWAAAYVDRDPEEGLRLIRAARSGDPYVAQAEAKLLATLGRFEESNRIFEQQLTVEPANQRLLRMRAVNLSAEGRIEELARHNRWLDQLAPPERDPCRCMLVFTGKVEFQRASFAELLEAAAAAPDSVALFTALGELPLLRLEGRYEESRKLLQHVRADSVRVAGFTSVLAGLGRWPIADLSGWNDLLLGDREAAANSGRDVLDFIGRQTVTKNNEWFLRMLAADAHLFMGDSARATAVAREALRGPFTDVDVQHARELMAVQVLAWSGEHDEATALLEHMTSTAPQLYPVIAARDPLVALPLREHQSYRELQRQLEAAIARNAELLVPTPQHANLQ